MLLRTEGIVLKSTRYGEADLLVSFLTRDHGLRQAFARSPRKLTSRFGSSLEPLTLSRISLMGKEDAAFPRLTQCDIIESFQGLREDYHCFLQLSGMIELTLHFLREGVRSPESFELLASVLRLMEGRCSALYTLLYKVRLLGLKGYLPHVGGCARCGKESSEFHIPQGSMMCAPCAPAVRHGRGEGQRLSLSAGSVRLFSALSSWDLEKTVRLKASKEMLEELEGLVAAHVQYILAKPLKTNAPAPVTQSPGAR
jgi:DNA repair protein RecO (recombination protein O)